MLKEKLKKLYGYFLHHDCLSKDNLLEMGFNNFEISGLILSGVIKEENEYYYASSSEMFCEYGIELIKKHDYDSALFALKKSYLLDPNNLKVYKEILTMAYKSRNTTLFLTWIDKLLNHENPNARVDGRFYLYLYSNVAKIPGKYLEIVKETDFYDVRIDYDNPDYSDALAYNRVRGSVTCKSYYHALRQLNAIIDANKTMTIDDILTKELLRKNVFNTSRRKANIINLVEQGEYGLLVDALEAEQVNYKLNRGDSSILMIAKAFRDNTLVQNDIDNPNVDLFTAIQQQDYRLALKLNDNYIKYYKISKEKSALNLILNKANQYLDQIEQDETEKLDCDKDSIQRVRR